MEAERVKTEAVGAEKIEIIKDLAYYKNFYSDAEALVSPSIQSDSLIDALSQMISQRPFEIIPAEDTSHGISIVVERPFGSQSPSNRSQVTENSEISSALMGGEEALQEYVRNLEEEKDDLIQMVKLHEQQIHHLSEEIRKQDKIGGGGSDGVMQHIKVSFLNLVQMIKP